MSVVCRGILRSNLGEEEDEDEKVEEEGCEIAVILVLFPGDLATMGQECSLSSWPSVLCSFC